MADAGERVRAEISLIEKTLSLLDETFRRKTKGQVERMAIGGFVCNVYSGIENILKNVLRARGAPLPGESSSFHRDLLDIATSCGLISDELREELDDYRGFRHFFVHGYGITLRPAELQPLVERLPAAWKELRAQIEKAVI